MSPHPGTAVGASKASHPRSVPLRDTDRHASPMSNVGQQPRTWLKSTPDSYVRTNWCSTEQDTDQSFCRGPFRSCRNGEMDEHLGYEKHAIKGRATGNSRNGTPTETTPTDNAGQFEIAALRDRAGIFEPVIVAKCHSGSETSTRSSSRCRRMPKGEISAQFHSNLRGLDVEGP